jgi:hypothetical protein
LKSLADVACGTEEEEHEEEKLKVESGKRKWMKREEEKLKVES